MKKFPELNIEKMLQSFHQYMAFDQAKVSRAEFEANLTGKLNDKAFLNDIFPLLPPNSRDNYTLNDKKDWYDPINDVIHVQERIISKLPSIIKPGEIQRMSAGSGVLHSEFNHSEKEELHLLQIWILPEIKAIEPSYEQKQIPQIRNQLILIGSKHPSHHVVKIHQNIELYIGYYDQDQSLSFPLNHDIWIQLIREQLNVNQYEIFSGDGMWIQQEELLQLKCIQDADFLLFKMG